MMVEVPAIQTGQLESFGGVPGVRTTGGGLYPPPACHFADLIEAWRMDSFAFEKLVPWLRENVKGEKF